MIFANAGLLWLWWWPTFDFERIRKGTLQPKVLCLCVAWSRGVRARQGPVFNLLINWVLGGLTIPASHQPGGRGTAGLNAKLQTMEGSNVMKVYRRVGVDRSTAACRQFKYCNNIITMQKPRDHSLWHVGWSSALLTMLSSLTTISNFCQLFP